MTARMTGTAWGRGLTNAMICSLGIIVVLGFMTAIGVFLFQQSFSFSLLMSYAIFMAAVVVFFFVGWYLGRVNRGKILHDCGPHPTRWLFFLNMAFFLFLGWNAGAETFTDNFNLYRTGVAIFFVVFALYWLVLSFGHLLVCENGLWQYWALLPWKKIDHYEWKNDTLLLKSNARFALLKKGAIPVSPVDRPKIDELLQKHVNLPASSNLEPSV